MPERLLKYRIRAAVMPNELVINAGCIAFFFLTPFFTFHCKYGDFVAYVFGFSYMLVFKVLRHF